MLVHACRHDRTLIVVARRVCVLGDRAVVAAHGMDAHADRTGRRPRSKAVQNVRGT